MPELPPREGPERAGGGPDRAPSDEAPVVSPFPSSASSYDEIPYESHAIFDTHPNHLAMIAALHGVDAADPATCRVLELGCARGDNVMAMATGLPGASFVGVDGSARQIADGERRRGTAGLENVRLIAADFSSLPDLGEFDYVLCHGVYSWVPPAVADLILRLCRRHLAPAGIAYVSYNTNPGWHRKSMVREMMAFHVRAIEEPLEKIEQARAFVAFLARYAKDDEGTYRAVFEKLAAHLDAEQDYYFFHEYLEDHNHPLYFTEFVDRAAAAGLSYVGTTQFTAWESNLPPDLKESLEGLGDRIVREQYVDFLCSRMFRRSVLAREGVAVRDTPDPAAVRGFFLRGRVRPARPDPEIATERPEKFEAGDDVSITTASPLMKALLLSLSRRAPAYLSFEEVEREVSSLAGFAAGDPSAASDRLAGAILASFLSGLVSLSRTRPAFAAGAGGRPRMSPLARVQAAEEDRATTLEHRVIRLDDLSRFLIPFCNGTRDREDLAKLLAAAVARDEFSLSDPEGQPVRDPERLMEFARGAVQTAVDEFARAALVMEED